MSPQQTEDDPAAGPVTIWAASVDIPTYQTILYYFFEIRDGPRTVYYIDDDPGRITGGSGEVSGTWNDAKSFAITVYDAAFTIPDWLQGAIIYQIFPDRFRNGDEANDPVDGKGWVYGRPTRLLPWNRPLCDPRSVLCYREFDNQFYGGDLRGIIDQLDYIKSLGATAIYLNPIFASPSNHGYDTTDYFAINRHFGTLGTFDELIDQARQRGMHVILDGVFNHTSIDHPFFDYFNRYDSAGRLTSPDGPGSDDGSGACESPQARHRLWYTLPAAGQPARTEDQAGLVLCPRSGADEPGETRSTFESWWGIYTLPKLNTYSEAVRLYLYKNGLNSVAPYWVARGAAGWRLDVGPDIDGGMIAEPHNNFWEGFRTAVKDTDQEAAIIGECWTSIVPFLLGNEWDSSMNYRFRGMMLNWMFDGCSGHGCTDGRSFQDNDNNVHTFSGPIEAVSETVILEYAKSRLQSSPKASRHGVVSLLGSHDTNRLSFVLRKISNNDAEMAVMKQRFLALVMLTTPGAPMIYYGDEVGITADGVWDGSTWQDDPYNRAPYPWTDAGLTPDNALLEYYRALGRIHNELPALKAGDFTILVADNFRRVMAFRRFDGPSDVVVVLNRHSHRSQTVEVPVSGIYTDGATLVDRLSGRRVTVSGGILKVEDVGRLSGLILTAD